MADQLDGVRLKIKRAWDQLNALNRDIRSYLRDDPTPYATRVNFDRNTHLLTIALHLDKLPDPMWGIRIGEIVHNLRSALDHVVWELAAFKRVRTPHKLLTQFPIFETAAGFKSRGIPKFLNGVSTKAIRLIKSEQPMPKADGGTGEGRDLSPLWHLKELSDTDKHCTIHVAGALIHHFHFSFPRVTRTVRVEQLYRAGPGPIEQDAMLAQDRFSGDWPFADAQVKCEIMMDIAFEQGTPAVGGWIVPDTLIGITNRTERVLRRMAEELFRTEL